MAALPLHHVPFLLALRAAMHFRPTTLLDVAIATSLLRTLLLERFYTPLARPELRVAVTGADTGFGNALVMKLAKMHPDYTIFAGLLTSDGEKSLANLPNVRTVRCDVTSERDLEAFAEAVGEQIDVVVCNAGVALDWLIDFTPLETFRKVSEVNYLGVVGTVKALLPAMKRNVKNNPRVIIVTSMLSRVTLPGTAAYCASKHAAGSFAEALQREMGEALDVTTVEPGFFQTQIVTGNVTHRQKYWNAASSELKAEYGGQETFEKSNQLVETLYPLMSNPEVVVETMRRLCVDERAPPSRVALGRDNIGVLYPISMLPVPVQHAIFRLFFPPPYLGQTPSISRAKL